MGTSGAVLVQLVTYECPHSNENFPWESFGDRCFACLSNDGCSLLSFFSKEILNTYLTLFKIKSAAVLLSNSLPKQCFFTIL